MFEIGDKIVCVDDTGLNEIIRGHLKMYKIYIISDASSWRPTISLENINDIRFSCSRFKLLSEFRKEKIKRICSNLEK